MPIVICFPLPYFWWRLGLRQKYPCSETNERRVIINGTSHGHRLQEHEGVEGMLEDGGFTPAWPYLQR